MKKPSYHINRLKGLPIAFLFLFMALFAWEQAFAGSMKTDWQKLSTQRTVLLFQDSKDLHKFNTKINFGTDIQTTNANLTHTIIQKVDDLFERSRELLEMHGFVNKIMVKIFKDKQQLDQAYRKQYQKQGSARAWYSHDNLTVYVQLNDLHEGMLAHEFAHAVIDHYLIVPPPGRTAEILARYVDNNLHKQNFPDTENAHAQGYSAQ
ncbi:MAG: hypothetical protein L3J69_17110 [Desulfobacula sp.]|nr:hypothetical protein [Desulfobacula sp.]